MASDKSEDVSEPAGDATSDGTVSIATPPNLDLLWEVDSSEHGNLYAIDFAPRGDTLAVGGRSVSLWHPGETKPFAELNEATVDFNLLQTVKALGYSPDGALLAMGCDDGSLCIWSFAEDSLPVPSEAEWIEVDDAHRLMCFNCPWSVTQLAGYYRAQMPTIGWTPLGDGQQTDGGASLSYLRGDDLLEVRLTATPEGTRARVGDVPNNLSWIMQVAGGRTSVVGNTVGADEPKNGGIEAADVPIPQDAINVMRKRQSGVIQFETALSPKEVAAFYLEAMKALGWKESDNNLVDDNFARIGWTQGDAELGIRASTSGVNLSGNGLLWSKAIPDDALLISFALWLKRNGPAPGLERLDDYVQEMKP